MNYEQLEQARLAIQNKEKKINDIFLTIFFGFIAVILIVSAITSFSAGTETSIFTFGFSTFAMLFPFVFFLIIPYLIVRLFATSAETAAYRDAYKSYFITATFNKIFTNLSYSHTSAMPKEYVSGTGMMNMGDLYSSNDYTVAKYKGIPFKQADVHLQNESTDSDGNTTYHTIFLGRYVIFDYNKKFDKKLLVVGKNFDNSKIDKTFKKIQLESNEFNKNFYVYAQDGFEAYYLLDPAVMERIMKLDDLHNGRVMVCFLNNQIHIAINNNTDSFEPASYKKPIDEKHEFNKVMNDIKVITNIIDEIKLVK